MTMRTGAAIVEVLESTAKRCLGPEEYGAFLFQLEGSGALHRYDRSEIYWERVQALLDGFFRSAERATICEVLLADAELRRQPEFHGFLLRALAERRIQDLAQVMATAQPARQRRRVS